MNQAESDKVRDKLVEQLRQDLEHAQRTYRNALTEAFDAGAAFAQSERQAGYNQGFKDGQLGFRAESQDDPVKG